MHHMYVPVHSADQRLPTPGDISFPEEAASARRPASAAQVHTLHYDSQGRSSSKQHPPKHVKTQRLKMSIPISKLTATLVDYRILAY